VALLKRHILDATVGRERAPASPATLEVVTEFVDDRVALRVFPHPSTAMAIGSGTLT
jgi:hypothetical protein